MMEKWPVKDVDFYQIASDNIIKVKNNDRLDDEFYEYALKFKRSGNILTKYLFSKVDSSKLDTYFFSIAFLYRHSIELILKAIGFKYINKLDDRKAFIKDSFHNLSKLLETITPSVNSLIAEDREGYAWLEAYFEDVDVIDKESDSFRYPFRISVEKENNIFETTKRYSIKPVFDKQTHINLVAFVSKLEIAFELLKSLYEENFCVGIDYKTFNPTFLEEGGNYYAQSVVGYTYNSKKFYPYVRAYTKSAEYLYDKICEDNTLKDSLFIPMCYMYRNSIELSLKEILFEECSFNFQESLRHINKKKHKVLGLWNLIKAEIEEHANAPSDDETMINVEKYIFQLNDIDSSSDKFRYPTNKRLDLHFNKTKKFDMDNVNSLFTQLLWFLRSVDAMMSAHNEWKSEMEADSRAEMEAAYRAEMADNYNGYY